MKIYSTLISLFPLFYFAQDGHISRHHVLSKLPRGITMFDGARNVLFEMEKIKPDSVWASSTLESDNFRYQPSNVVDNTIKTAWADGESNNGENSELSFLFDKNWPPAFIKITPGYAKNEITWQNNNRVTKFRLDIIGEYNGKNRRNLRSYEVELSPNKLKPRSFYLEIGSSYSFDNSLMDFTEIKITILETDKGLKYDDTCISDVKFYFQTNNEIE